MIHSIYAVYFQGMEGKKLISSHLDEKVAELVANMNAGWVETDIRSLNSNDVAYMEQKDSSWMNMFTQVTLKMGR